MVALTASIFIAFNPASVVAQTGTPGPAQLPTLGDGSDISSSAERRLGDRIARELYRDPDYLDDPVLADYVQGIWQPLMAAARARGDLTPELEERFAWEILLGRDRSVNAFALPGGYLGVHLGLIAVVANRDELASVLGHELSHVTQRHISRLMSKQSQQAPWMLGAMILGALAASKSPDAGNAMMMGGQALAMQNQLNFSRDMEREADRVGFGIMTQAGFEAQGFASMFDKLQQASRLNDNGAYPYLRSHPLSTERIADMRSRQVLQPGTPVAAMTTEHAMIVARARVLSNPGVDALRALRAEAQGDAFKALSAPRQVGALYGAALAANQMRDFTEARDSLARLNGRVQGDARALRLVRWLAAEVALTAGNAQLAVTTMVNPTQAFDSPADRAASRPELLLGAMASIRLGEREGVQRAAQRLQSWVATHPRDAQAWQLLSSAHAVQGHTLRAIRADAETQVAQLDYAAALTRFKAAQDMLRGGTAGRSGDAAADHIDASIIDTRQRQVELLLREQTLDR
jgi:predicted Zn-dependent protease